jgi:FkbM family methyltransferase
MSLTRRIKNKLKRVLGPCQPDQSKQNEEHSKDETEEFRNPFKYLPLTSDEVDLVVDVGAFNGGYTSLALSRYAHCKVIAFEPTPASIEEFQKNLREYADRIVLYPVALSSKAGQLNLHVTNYGPANSLYPQALEHQRQNPEVREKETVSVAVSTLDIKLASENKIDILKIDVEGAEVDVLIGAHLTLELCRFVIVEISLARDKSVEDQAVFEIFGIMKERGFSLYSIADLYRIDPPRPHWGKAQFDAIFKNQRFNSNGRQN